MSDPVSDTAAPLHDEEAAPAPTGGVAAKAAFAIGSIGLMTAMAADSIAVLGRHTGFTLLGSIEIVQAAIVFIAAASMVSVTLSRGHAAVHILTDRLTPPRKAAMARVASAFGAVALLALAAGSAILLVDLWGGFERSELLHIPLRWLRLLMIVALVVVAALFARDALVRGHRDDA